MLRTIIIDDEAHMRESLAEMLKSECPGARLVAQADGVETGMSVIQKYHPDLVLLDIRMKDGTGFDLLEKFENIDFNIIFVTAYDEYAIKAIKFSALDYLLKPIDPDELIAAVNKLEAQPQKNALNDSLNLLLENIKEIQPESKRIALSSADKVIMVYVKDIVRCESQGSYTIFYLQDKEEIVTTKNLKEYEQLLVDFSFVRVHHSHLINFSFLKEYIKKDGGYAVMQDGSNVPVSFRKRNNLLDMINS